MRPSRLTVRGCPDGADGAARSDGVREFNTVGPVVAADHYLIPPLHLRVFDRRERTWKENILRRPPPPERPPITVWGM